MADNQEPIIDLIRGYLHDTQYLATCHRMSASYFKFLHNIYSGIIKLLPFVSSAVLIASSSETTRMVSFGIGCLAGLVAIGQDVLSFATRASEHKSAFLNYAEMSRQINFFLLREHNDDQLDGTVDLYQERITQFERISPSIIQSIKSKAKAGMNNESKRASMRKEMMRFEAKAHGKSKDVFNNLNKMNIEDLRKILRQSSHSESPPASHDQCVVSVSRCSNVSMSKRRPETLTQIKHVNKDRLIESVLFDCNITMKSIRKVQEQKAKKEKVGQVVFNEETDIEQVAKAIGLTKEEIIKDDSHQLLEKKHYHHNSPRGPRPQASLRLQPEPP
jgi:hypothetical protein